MADTDDTQKMLQIIINGQSSFRQEMLKKFDQIDRKFESVGERFDSLEDNLTARINKLGKQLAYLEDDAPTREEFNTLEKRVVEQKSILPHN